MATIADFMAHWDDLVQRNLISRTMAQASRSACWRVLSVQDNQEQLDPLTLDVEEAWRVFDKRAGNELSEQTKEVYHRRFRQGIQQFREYMANPEGWRGKRTTRRNRKTGMQSASRRRDRHEVAPSASEMPQAESQQHTYEFPLLAGDRTVRLGLPVDLKMSEVRRIVMILQALAVDFDAQERPAVIAGVNPAPQDQLA
jgi:hypothetical protein